MKYKLSFDKRIIVLAVLSLISFYCPIFSHSCFDLAKSTPLIPMLHAMAPAGQIIRDGRETIITEEGSYRLVEDVQGSIVVDANKVIIDLNGFTLSSDATNSDNLITVDRNVTDVVIKNGAIVGNCSNYGIRLFAGVKRVSLDNIRISNVLRGIGLIGSFISVESCRITNCRISNCDIGVRMINGDKNIFKNVEVCCFESYGFALQRCEFNKFDQCKALRGGNSNTDDNKPNVGFYSIAGQDNLFYECFAEGICKEAALFDTKTAGFFFGIAPNVEYRAAEFESKIINCCVDSIVSSSWGNAVGVLLDSELLDSVTSVTYGKFIAGGPFNDVAWSPGCGLIALSDEGNASVKIIKFDGEKLSGPIVNIPGNFVKVAWSANGRYLLYINSVGNLFVRDIRTGGTYAIANPAGLTDAAWFNKSLNFVAVDGVDVGTSLYKFIFDDNRIYLVKENNEIEEGKKVIAVTPDDCFIATAGMPAGTGPGASQGKVVVYDSEDLGAVHEVTALSGEGINALDWNPIACCNRRYLAVAGETDGTSNIEVFEFNGITLTSIATAEFDSVIHSIKWSPRGKDFLVISEDHNVGVFNFDPSAVAGSRVTQIIGLSYSTIIGGSIPDSAIYADWSPCGDYIVIAGAPSNTVDASDVEVILVGNTVKNCVVEGNKIANVCGGLCGLGIWGSGCCNLIDDNVVCCSGVPYTSGVYGRYLGGLLGTAGYLENLYGNDYCVCCPCTCESRVCDCGCIPCDDEQGAVV